MALAAAAVALLAEAVALLAEAVALLADAVALSAEAVALLADATCLAFTSVCKALASFTNVGKACNKLSVFCVNSTGVLVCRFGGTGNADIGIMLILQFVKSSPLLKG